LQWVAAVLGEQLLEQGGGRLDVAAVVGDVVRGDPAVFLDGRFPDGHAERLACRGERVTLVGQREGEGAQVEEVAAELVRGRFAVLAVRAVFAVVGDQLGGVGLVTWAEGDEGALAVERLDRDPRPIRVGDLGPVAAFVVPEHERVTSRVPAAPLRERDGEPREVVGQVEAHHPGPGPVGAAPEHRLDEHSSRVQRQGVLGSVGLEHRQALRVGGGEVVVVEQSLLDQL
jgi:hypothetical protein